MIALRDYQERAIAALRASYAAGRRAPVLVAPTGAGKTRIAAAIISMSVARGNRVLFCAHRAELIEQTARALADAGIGDVRVIKAGAHTGRSDAPVAVASVQTITRWDPSRMPDVGLVVFDECHHCPARTFRRIAEAYPHAKLLGLTATPQRADGQPLGDVFDDLIVAATVRELTELGHLVPCRIWAPPGVLDAGDIAIDPVDAYERHGDGQRAIVFCSTVAYATALGEEFHRRGHTATTLHGEMGADTRRRVLAWFRDGELRVLTSVGILTEGFDDPGVSVAILCRRPEHAGTYLQIVGRILRPAPGKTHATLIDLCGSALVHGTPDMARAYGLSGRAISKPERDAIRQCPTCGAVFLAGPAHCPTCGTELPRRPTKPPRVVGVGLADATGTDQLRINLLAAARRTGRSRDWVERAHAAITGDRHVA